MNAILEHRPFLYGYSLLLLGFAALALTYVMQGQPSSRSSSSSSMPFDERYVSFSAGFVFRPPQAASSMTCLHWRRIVILSRLPSLRSSIAARRSIINPSTHPFAPPIPLPSLSSPPLTAAPPLRLRGKTACGLLLPCVWRGTILSSWAAGQREACWRTN